MIKVAGIWELGYSAPLVEFDVWQFMLRDFGVDQWIMTPVSGIAQPIHEVAAMEDAISENPELTPVFVDEKGKTTLKDFEHPANALYLFGKASYSPFTALAQEGECSIRVETVNNQGLLWPHQAAAIVLYDRLMKS